MVIEAAEKEQSKYLQSIPENEEMSKSNFKFTPFLKPMFTRFIVPFLTDKQPENMPNSLNAFRNQYIWTEKVNTLLELNLEGIMEVFMKF